MLATRLYWILLITFGASKATVISPDVGIRAIGISGSSNNGAAIKATASSTLADQPASLHSEARRLLQNRPEFYVTPRPEGAVENNTGRWTATPTLSERYYASATNGRLFTEEENRRYTSTVCNCDFCWPASAARDSPNGAVIVGALVIILILLILSAICNGLTIGVTSMNTLALRALEKNKESESNGDLNTDDQDDMLALHDRMTGLIQKNGNLFLCTFLFGKCLITAFLSTVIAASIGWIMMVYSTVQSPVVGAVVTIAAAGFTTTFLTLVVSELVPLIVCTRHPNWLVNKTTIELAKWVVYISLLPTWPIYRIMLLDSGQQLLQLYNVTDIKKLLNIEMLHVRHRTDDNSLDKSNDDGLVGRAASLHLLTGALEYKEKCVLDVMTSLDKVFMLELHQRLNFEILFEIHKSGFTRIPIYSTRRQNIVGLLYCKDLILVDPDDEIEVSTLLAFHGDRGYVKKVPDNTSLDIIFRHFKDSFVHLLFVFRSPTPDVQLSATSFEGVHSDDLKPADNIITGVITLEDVLEAIVASELVDETDNYVDVNNADDTAIVRKRDRGVGGDLSQLMKLFDHKIRNDSKLSKLEANAIVAHLTANVDEFKPMASSPSVIKDMVLSGKLMEYDPKNDVQNAIETIDINGSKRRATNASVKPLSCAGLRPFTSTEDVNQRHPSTQIKTMKTSRHVNKRHSSTQDTSDVNTSAMKIYSYGVPADYFTIILQGKLQIKACSEQFSSELGPWSVLGTTVLNNHQEYFPDFEAVMSSPCRLLIINRDSYRTAIALCGVVSPSSLRDRLQLEQNSINMAAISVNIVHRDNNEEHDTASIQTQKLGSESPIILPMYPSSLHPKEDGLSPFADHNTDDEVSGLLSLSNKNPTKLAGYNSTSQLPTTISHNYGSPYGYAQAVQHNNARSSTEASIMDQARLEYFTDRQFVDMSSVAPASHNEVGRVHTPTVTQPTHHPLQMAQSPHRLESDIRMTNTPAEFAVKKEEYNFDKAGFL